MGQRSFTPITDLWKYAYEQATSFAFTAPLTLLTLLTALHWFVDGSSCFGRCSLLLLHRLVAWGLCVHQIVDTHIFILKCRHVLWVSWQCMRSHRASRKHNSWAWRILRLLILHLMRLKCTIMLGVVWWGRILKVVKVDLCLFNMGWLLVYKRLYSSIFLIRWLSLLGRYCLHVTEDSNQLSIWTTIAIIWSRRGRLWVQLIKRNITFCCLWHLKKHLNRLWVSINPTILSNILNSYEGSTNPLLLWKYLLYYYLSTYLESSSKQF